MSTVPNTSGRLHSEYIRLLFLETHRETDLFLTTSGSQIPQQNCGLFGELEHRKIKKRLIGDVFECDG